MYILSKYMVKQGKGLTDFANAGVACKINLLMNLRRETGLRGRGKIGGLSNTYQRGQIQQLLQRTRPQGSDSGARD